MSKDESTHWHQLSKEDAVTHLESDMQQGLHAEDIAQLQQEYGQNLLPQGKNVPWWQRLLRQFKNLLIYVLLVAAALAAMLGEWIDMAVILAVVLVNAIIGFFQEGKAEKALKSIQGMLSSNALVIRDGEKQQIAAKELVPGDVIVLEAGAKVPADVRLLKSNSLAIQEAALTGESLAIEKETGSLSQDTALADRRNMAFSGTLITQGQGTGLVVATGSDTELGRINKMLSGVEELTTPLLRQMAQFARYLTFTILGVAALVFLFGMLRGNDPSYLFMAIVSLVVAAIPEGLPTILTVALAIGVTRMASRNSIIRRLPAVETLGAVSVICSDKTGTLTRNEMMVTQLQLSEETVDVSGTGYEPTGEFSAQPELLQELALAALLCNDSSLEQKDDQWAVRGDPMEGALLTMAYKSGLTDDDQKAWPRDAEIPFDSKYKYMATAHHKGEDARIFVKGAPERVIDMCSSDFTDGGYSATRWKERVDELAAEGQRVLALAVKKCSAKQEQLEHEELQDELQLIGLVALMDPPREEALKAIRACHEAGIAVKMITGDHGATARAIGEQLELKHTDRAITGSELDEMDDEALTQAILDTDVFARTTPEHKLRLVKALQAQNLVVAMTGDGVNDAPALKRADVGIAMGRNGTEAAREASEMVLTDDNFASIVNAVHEGRTVYDNLKKAISFLLPVNGGESLAIILALLFALTLPIMPLQILWVNMVSSIALALALAFEPSEKDVMQRPPRRADEAWLSGFLVWRVVFVSLLFTTGIFAVFQWGLAQGFEDAYARTLAVNTLVAMEVWYLFSVRYLHGASLTWHGIKGSRPVILAVSLVLVLQLLFTYLPILQTLFDTQGLSLRHGLLCVAIGILLFIVLEAEKWLRRRLNHA
ncbi:carbonate dehydratase [Aliidiomarina minuta]|uniref:Carbonate dehydratase n=1 Tax=Aliidiomarina minuta TaxID=880057 RepID=A0A432W6N4_9GAMM|nr:HAD-IC family P-type ATPase [Aliidiomarina minuta]RUO25735.1 carbonate dehydratase [Aliidiomarina minuta]